MIIDDVIFHPYKIEFDGSCYIVYKESTVKSGDFEGVVKKEAIVYPTTVKSLINWFVRQKTADVNITTTFKGFLRVMERNEKLYTSKIEELLGKDA